MKRIVYSTCSIHATENEHVVSKALEAGGAKQNGFRLAPRSEVLPSWHRRGIPEEMMSGTCARCSAGDISIGGGRLLLLADDAECVVRCSPGEDATNGFFVSCFVRQSQGELTRLGKRSRASVNDDDVGVETVERCKRIHMEKGADGQKRNRPKKRKSSAST